MIDCFISTLCLEKHYPLRQEVARQCIPAFVAEAGLRVRILDFGSHPEQQHWLDHCGAAEVHHESPLVDLAWTLEGSERRRFLFAARLAQSDIYIVTDDDCLPTTEGWVGQGEAILRAHAEFGMLALSERRIHRLARPQLYSDTDVVETFSCGGVRFIRKGAVKRFRGYERERGYDQQHARAMKASGYKVGFFRNLYREHLGGKCSVYRGRVTGTQENDRADGTIAEA